MFQGPRSWRDFVIRCKGCGENIPGGGETLPASWIAVKCPLCSEHRRYLPTEVFQGRVSYALIRKPVPERTGRDKVRHVRPQRTHPASESHPNLHEARA